MNWNRKALTEEVLKNADPREFGKQKAAEYGLNFGLLWEWVLIEATERADASITSERIVNCINGVDSFDLLFEELDQDRTLVKINHFYDLLRAIELPVKTFQQLLDLVSKDPTKDGYFGDLITREDIPTTLLFQFIEQDRFIGEIAHRKGPEEVLLKIIELHDSVVESVLTLAFSYYANPNYPIDKFAEFIEKHKAKYGNRLRRNFELSDSPPEDRKEIVAQICREKP